MIRTFEKWVFNMMQRYDSDNPNDNVNPNVNFNWDEVYRKVL